MKRVTDVVRVFAKVTEHLGARLLMVGDGPDHHEAFELASALGVSGRVSFLGSFPRIEGLLSVCDLFLLPSVKESFGLAALEAMAAGVPVIASRTGGVPEVVEDGVTGFLCAERDVSGMAAAALKLLSDETLHAQFARAARKRAVTEFSERKAVPLYQRVCDEALSLRPVSLRSARADGRRAASRAWRRRSSQTAF